MFVWLSFIIHYLRTYVLQQYVYCTKVWKYERMNCMMNSVKNSTLSKFSKWYCTVGCRYSTIIVRTIYNKQAMVYNHIQYTIHNNTTTTEDRFLSYTYSFYLLTTVRSILVKVWYAVTIRPLETLVAKNISTVDTTKYLYFYEAAN
jgi:hypothetical protein